MSQHPIPEVWAGRILDLLIQDAGAHARDRDQFMRWAKDGYSEFRFCGTLGFGGKFWNNAGRWYISCYKEDSTPERERTIQAVNEKLVFLHECALQSS